MYDTNYEKKNTAVLYGFEGASQMYRPARYWAIQEGDLTVSEVKVQAIRMKEYYPSIREIWLIDNRRGLAWEYKAACKAGSIESYAVFKDTVEREGVRIL